MTAAQDPLFQAIENYRAGMSAFAGMPEFETDEAEEAAIGQTYGPPSDVLMNWKEPAASRTAAVEVLRLALDEARDYSASDTLTNMISAALRYFEQEGGAA